MRQERVHLVDCEPCARSLAGALAPYEPQLRMEGGSQLQPFPSLPTADSVRPCHPHLSHSPGDPAFLLPRGAHPPARSFSSARMAPSGNVPRQPLPPCHTGPAPHTSLGRGLRTAEVGERGKRVWLHCHLPLSCPHSALRSHATPAAVPGNGHRCPRMGTAKPGGGTWEVAPGSLVPEAEMLSSAP